MKSCLPANAIACVAAALLAAGCGSSGSGGSSAGATATTTSTTASTAASTGAQTSSSQPHSELKADTAPKYASPSPSEAPKTGTVQIVYRNFAIDPDTARAKVGATIKNQNGKPRRNRRVPELSKRPCRSP